MTHFKAYFDAMTESTSKNDAVNKNIIDVIDPFPDIFDNFDSFFIYFF